MVDGVGYRQHIDQDVQKEERGHIREVEISSPPQQNDPLCSHIKDLYALTNLVTPYVFRPFTFTQIYIPIIMWPFTTPFSPARDIPSLAGKVILVTGGNAGLGRETILQLAKHNPSRIYMASRNESKALAAIASLKKSLPADSKVEINHLPLDLSSLQSVRTAAQTFNKSNSRLDTLILNAGIMATPAELTPSGHEVQLGTNHIGHFLLTKLLLPTLQSTASTPNSDVRIISVSSEAFNLAPSLETILSTDKLAATGPWTRYGASKAANILFAAELARRYPALKSVSLHPGLIMTDLYSPSGMKSNLFVRAGMAVVGPLMFRSVAQGAENQLWAAAGSKEEELVDGGYYTPVGKAHAGNKWAVDVEGGKKLWEWTEGELGKCGY